MADAPQAANPRERVSPVRALPFQITPLAEKQRWLKGLFYGKPGAGKTTLLGSSADVPSMRDVLLLDIESGDLSLHNNDRIQHPEFISSIPLKSFGSVDLIKDWLQAHCKYRDAGDEEQLAKLEEKVTGKLPQKPKHFRTLLIDSVSELDGLSMNRALGIDDSISLDDDIAGAEWAHYKQNFTRMMILLRRLRDLPMNVLMSCHTKWVQDEQKRMHYSPALTGQLKDSIQGLTDIVGFLVEGAPTEGKESPRRLYVQPTPGIKCDAKNRWAPYKQAYFDDPTMLSIFKAVGLMK